MKAKVPVSPYLSWTVLLHAWQLLLVLPFTLKNMSLCMMNFIVTLFIIKVYAVQLKDNERKTQETQIFIPTRPQTSCVGLIIINPHLKVCSPDQQHQRHLGACQKCSSGPTPDLLKQNQHFNQIPRGSGYTGQFLKHCPKPHQASVSQ